MRVKDDDCDVPMLSLDDFEFHPFSPEIVDLWLRTEYWADNTWLTQRQSFAFSMNINASSRWWGPCVSRMTIVMCPC
jgi:hypothetical protein